MQNEIPLPPPQPNDGSLNTVMPAQDTISAGPSSINKKRLGLIALFGIIATASILYAIASYPQNSSAKNTTTPANLEKKMQTIASPTATMVKTELEEVENIDLGDIDTEMKDVIRDLDSL